MITFADKSNIDEIKKLLGVCFGDKKINRPLVDCMLFTDHQHIVVKKVDGKIVGTTTLYILPKLIHGGSYVGLIEDVAVLPEHRGNGYARQMVEYIVNMAKDINCYKVILNSSEDNIGLYEKLGFERAEHQMRKDLL